VAAEASNFLMGRTFLDIDMARAADLLGMERRQAEMFRDLRAGISWRSARHHRRPLPLRIGPVETGSRGGGPKLVPPPEAPSEAARELIMKAAATPEPRAAPPPRRPSAPPPDILAQLAATRPAPIHDRAPAERRPAEEERRELAPCCGTCWPSPRPPTASPPRSTRISWCAAASPASAPARPTCPSSAACSPSPAPGWRRRETEAPTGPR
jgi:hypothetical protein